MNEITCIEFDKSLKMVSFELCMVLDRYDYQISVCFYIK